MTPGRRDDTRQRTRTNPRAAGAASARGAQPPAARAAYELDARISEAAFQEQVIQLARLGGWLHYHTRDSRGSQRGFPDLVLIHATRVLLVVAELKTQRGQVKPEQQDWHEALGEIEQFIRSLVGPGYYWDSGPAVQAHIWRPGDFDSIARLLLGPAYLGEVAAS